MSNMKAQYDRRAGRMLAVAGFACGLAGFACADGAFSKRPSGTSLAWAVAMLLFGITATVMGIMAMRFLRPEGLGSLHLRAAAAGVLIGVLETAAALLLLAITALLAAAPS